MQMRTLILLTFISHCAFAFSQDWSACSSELDSLRRRASDASSAADSAGDKQRHLKQAEDDYQNCRRYPQMYDLLRDGCRYKLSELESARNYYRNELGNLQSSLRDVESKAKAVNSSCGAELSRVTGPAPVIPEGVADKDYCAAILRYKGQLPIQSLIEICSKTKPITECKKCLGVN